MKGRYKFAAASWALLLLALVSCGAYAIGTFGIRSLEGELSRSLNHPDPLLRETALAAKERLQHLTAKIGNEPAALQGAKPTLAAKRWAFQLGASPAVAAGVTDRLWDVNDLAARRED
jgi:hypothetical protein